MAPARLALILLVLASLAGACGGGSESEDVKDSLGKWISSAETGSAERVCDGMTRDSRRLLDAIGKGRSGPKGDCAAAIEDRLEELASGGLSQGQIKAIDAADIDVEGDTAQVKGDAGERMTMRKVGGEWLVDFASLPDQGYGLRASAACTEITLRALRRPLPPATRRGLAKEAEAEWKGLERLLRTIEKARPPKGSEDAHKAIVRVLRATIADWRRVVSAMRGFGAPIKTYNRAMTAAYRRSQSVLDEQRELKMTCLGSAKGRPDAAEYRRESNRICRATGRRIDKLSASQVATRAPQLGRATARALKRVEAPAGLGSLHRRSADAMVEAFVQIPRLAQAGDVKAATERFELTVLRSAVGFVHLGLDTCAQL